MTKKPKATPAAPEPVSDDQFDEAVEEIVAEIVELQSEPPPEPTRAQKLTMGRVPTDKD